MAVTLEFIRSKIAQALPDAEIDVRDTTGGGDHFAATVVSSHFAGQLPLERHRLVYDALGEAMRGPIHALTLTTITPKERDEKSPKSNP